MCICLHRAVLLGVLHGAEILLYEKEIGELAIGQGNNPCRGQPNALPTLLTPSEASLTLMAQLKVLSIWQEENFRSNIYSHFFFFLLSFSIFVSGWNHWSEWSPCSQSCNGGEQRRIRTCHSHTCPSYNMERRTCNSFTCQSKREEDQVAIEINW